jgi:hypothetical protein
LQQETFRSWRSDRSMVDAGALCQECITFVNQQDDIVLPRETLYSVFFGFANIFIDHR